MDKPKKKISSRSEAIAERRKLPKIPKKVPVKKKQPESKVTETQQLWVEKYRPRKPKDFVGNVGVVAKVQEWLADFQARKPGTKRGILFSGSPGLGKTSLAHAVLEEAGYRIHEFNASNIRNKRQVHDRLSRLFGNTGVMKLFTQDSPVAIIMDEVDGMSAGDKGGMAELVSFINPLRGKTGIKKTDRERVAEIWYAPIICICNDRYDRKITELRKDVLEVQFQKPKVVDLQRVVDRIAKAEGFQIDAKCKRMVATFAQGDYRRLIGFLEVLFQKKHNKNDPVEFVEEDIQVVARSFGEKMIDLNLYDNLDRIIGKPLSVEEGLQIYEADKGLQPMMIHENYLGTIGAQRGPIMERLRGIGETIDSIVVGDVIERTIYNSQSWHLQPIHGINSCVIPNYYLARYPKKAGYHRSEFTKALGKYSTQRSNMKNLTVLQEIMNSRSGVGSYTVDDLRTFGEILLAKAFYKERASKLNKGLKRTQRASEQEEIEDPEYLSVIELLKQHNLRIYDLEKFIKMNKLSDFYQSQSSAHIKTVLRRISPVLFQKSTTKTVS